MFPIFKALLWETSIYKCTYIQNSNNPNANLDFHIVTFHRIRRSQVRVNQMLWKGHRQSRLMYPLYAQCQGQIVPR